MDIKTEASSLYDYLQNADSFAERLKKLMQLKDITGKQIGEQIGMSKSAISTLVTGKITNVSASTIFDLAKIFAVDPEWLFTGNGSPAIKVATDDVQEADSENINFRNINLMLSQTGYKSVESRAYYDHEFAILSNRFLRACHTVGEKCCLYSIRGDEMSPTVKDGDTVLVEHTDTIINGKIYAIMVDDETIICRKLYKKLTSDEVTLCCEDKQFSDEIVDLSFSHLKIIGRVLAIQNRILES